MQIITGTSLVAGLASSVVAISPSAAVSELSCASTSTSTSTSTVTSTVTSIVATVTVTVSTLSAWTSTEELSTSSSDTGVSPQLPGLGLTLTSTRCASGQVMAGINTEPGLNGTSYLVCAVSTASHPTVSTVTGKSTADAVGATYASAFTFLTTGLANATAGPAAGTGSGVAAHTTAVVAPTNSLVPFTGDAAISSVGGTKALVALAGVTAVMFFV